MDPFKWMEALRMGRDAGKLVETLEFLLLAVTQARGFIRDNNIARLKENSRQSERQEVLMVQPLRQEGCIIR